MFAQETPLVVGFPYVAATFLGAAGVIAFLFRALVTSKDQEIANLRLLLSEEQGLKKMSQDISIEAVKSAIETTNFYLQKEGKPPLILAEKVVSEGSSPPTEKQRYAAKAATLRAAMVVIRSVMGQEPREEPTGKEQEPT